VELSEKTVATQKTRNIRKFGSQMGPGVPEPQKIKKVSFLKKQLCLEKIRFGKPKFPPPLLYVLLMKSVKHLFKMLLRIKNALYFAYFCKKSIHAVTHQRH
jgi:hypothetical protein